MDYTEQSFLKKERVAYFNEKNDIICDSRK